MKILAELIHNPEAGSRKYDWRWKIWNSILDHLVSRGHKIQVIPVNQIAKQTSKYDIWDNKDPDFYISFSPYGGDREKRFKKYRKSCVVYDHGWLPYSLVVDRNKLFSDSYYLDKLASLSESNYDEIEMEKYRNHILTNNISKRPQDKKDKIPDVKYIFIPFQILKDVSIVHYSSTGMLEFVRKTTDYAKKHGIHVVGKLHPGMMKKYANHGYDEIHSFCNKMKKDYNNFHVVNTSIFDLMNKAEFTACVSSGSIIDNMLSLNPVYACGRTVFGKSGAIIHDEDVERGLDTMLNKSYDANHMILKQKQVLWWLRNNLIQEEFSIDKNIKLLEFHSGIKLI